MKIRSITDVITNSSTEVWAIRSNILEEARSLFRDESWREKVFEGDRKENLYDLFIDFSDLESIQKAWETPSGRNAIIEFISSELSHLFRPFKLTSGEFRLLESFNHTTEEIKLFEEKMNTERNLKLQASQEKFKDYLGWSVAVFYEHYLMWGRSEAGEKLRKWLKTNCDPKDWWYEY